MTTINKDDIDVKKMKYLGQGYNATCYKLNNNTVVKLFKNDVMKRYTLTKSAVYNDFDKLVELKNETIITPDAAIYDDNSFVGYVHQYVEGNSFSSICKSNSIINYLNRNKIKIRELFLMNYQELLNDIHDVSYKRFSLNNINGSDIILDSNNKFHLIDLDSSLFQDNYTESIIFSVNARRILNTIINNIFGSDTEFVNKDIAYLYRNIDPTCLRDILELIDTMILDTNSYNPSINQIKHNVKVKKKEQDYYFM